VQRLGQLAGETLGEMADRQIFVGRDQPGEIVRQPADRRRDRHVVVVEDHDQPIARGLRVVHRLVGHAGRHRAVADYRDCLARRSGKLVGGGKAERGRNGRGAVGGAERIILALAPLGEAGQASAHAQRADTVTPPGDDLVRIALMADVPDQPVIGRVEDVVERNGELDHAKPCAKVPARDRNGRDRLGPQLVRQLTQLLGREAAQGVGCFHPVEKRR
jgi:hypothetical protein